MDTLANYVHERPEAHPTIYAYTENNPQYKGFLKVGYTSINAEKRVAQQYPTKRPDGIKPYNIVLVESAMDADGSSFTDKAIHKILLKNKIECVGGEWFRCTVNDVRAAIAAAKTHTENTDGRTETFSMRPEQAQAVEQTIAYFKSFKEDNPDRVPKFLWNAKMRFGKTFAAYQLAKKMGLKKILILTFKPAVEAAWEEDLKTHVDFEGWQFIHRGGTLTYEEADKSRPIVCFGSFQDFLGTNENGGVKTKNEWVHMLNWDIVIFDEYHFGAWREKPQKLFEQQDEDVFESLDIEKYKKDEADNAVNESFLPITTDYYLFLSGTPFRALYTGEFIEEQIYNWTYSDEQRAKAEWAGNDNPYSAMPRMIMMTYQLPEDIISIAKQGEFDEFDINVFFSAKGTGEDAKFVYEDYVQKWLDLIRGAHLPTGIDDLKLGKDRRPPMPYSDATMLNVLTHTLWFLPNVASCYAMANLLKKRQNVFFHDYTVNICAGAAAGVGVSALEPVRKSMRDPLGSKTITLSCGKLTTGVTVKPWTGIFMLRNLNSPETYFQAAFRVQSPWEIIADGYKKEIIKHECYVFDFALDRALKQISSYSCNLSLNETSPEKKVEEFISFLPVLAYDGSTMKEVSASDILDIAMSGTSATLLAKRWESALLVNVDNETLTRLMNNEKAMNALMSIEGFRSLNSDIQTIINKSEVVKKAKAEKEEKLTKSEKKELSDAEKELKSKRKMIQEKLIKFATRIPVFMYLTDYREQCLKDVITQFEPGLFKKVTGLDVSDFNLLVELNVFNGPLMNDAIYKFKRYEDSSLEYTGINSHENEDVGGWDSAITRQEYERLYYNQQNSMTAETPKISVPVKEAVMASATIAPAIKTAPPKPKSTEEEKPALDLSGVVVGALVKHKIFGEGKIIEIDNKMVTVGFGNKEKRFEFPTAFEGRFLKLK